MMPFEVKDGDKVVMDYDRWHEWRDGQCHQFPTGPDRYRFDVEIAHPRRRLGEVPVERNPHSLGGFTARTCFYSCDDWSSIFGVHDARHPSGTSLRMVVENGHEDPLWGERVRLMSTSSYIHDEPWGHNPANRFALFRGKYWRVTNFEPLQPDSWRGTYPLSNLAASGIKHPDAIPPELLYRDMLSSWFVHNATVEIIHSVQDVYGRFQLHQGDPIHLGETCLVAWSYRSAATEPQSFVSVSPTMLGGFPELFCDLPDHCRGMLSLSGVGTAPHYYAERIASGVDRNRAIHFKLLNTVGWFPPPEQPMLSGNIFS